MKMQERRAFLWRIMPETMRTKGADKLGLCLCLSMMSPAQTHWERVSYSHMIHIWQGFAAQG